MSIPVHTLNLYEKPAVSNLFLKRFIAYNYRHTISAVGGFDTASCDITIRSRDEGQQFLNQYIGNRVAFYADDPSVPIWEGFINRMMFSAGGVQYTISLDEMANYVSTIYTAAASSPATSVSAAVQSTASQALYGIKGEAIDLGLMTAGTGVTLLRDTVLAQRAYPKASIIPGGGGDGMIHIEMLGFYHTLSWEGYRQTGTGAVQIGVLVDTILAALLNGTTFIDNTDTTLTGANTNTIDIQHAKGETAWDVFMKLREIGNASQYFIIGVTPTDFQTGTRRLYYQQANSTVEYTAKQVDGLRIRNLYGLLVQPWTVRPDAGIRVSDMLIGWDGVGDNPTETYMMVVDYDANSQTVIYRGDDDISAEGVFNYRRFNKSHGKRNGQARRVA